MSIAARTHHARHQTHGMQPVRVLVFALILMSAVGAILGAAAGIRAWARTTHDNAVIAAMCEFGGAGPLYVKRNKHTAILPAHLDGRDIHLVTEQEFVETFRQDARRPYLIEMDVKENYIHSEFPYLVKYEIYISRTDTIASHLSLLAHMHGSGNNYTYNCSFGPGKLVDRGGWIE